MYPSQPQSKGDCSGWFECSDVEAKMLHQHSISTTASDNNCISTCSENGDEPEHPKGSDSESTCFDESKDGSISSAGAMTTMMICNIPCRSTRDDVIEAIHSTGFADTYDFVYVPCGRRAATRIGNMGYAFVNFKSCQHAEDFAVGFDNFRFPGTHSSKTCTVKYAHMQGFNALNAAANARPAGKKRR